MRLMSAMYNYKPAFYGYTIPKRDKYIGRNKMDYKDITDNFIKEYSDYKSDVANFNEYIEVNWKNSLSGDQLCIILQGIDVDFILKSLIYNVETVKRVTYRELRKMKWDDYNEVYDCITVNGFELRLPLKLSIQLLFLTLGKKYAPC